MHRLGREVQSRTDCILGTDSRLFRKYFAWDPWHKSDHFIIMGASAAPPNRSIPDTWATLTVPFTLTDEADSVRQVFHRPEVGDSQTAS